MRESTFQEPTTRFLLPTIAACTAFRPTGRRRAHHRSLLERRAGNNSDRSILRPRREPILLKCEQSALAALLGLRVRQFVNFCEILIVRSAVNRAVVKILKQTGQPPEVISDLSLGRKIVTAINQAAAE